MPLLALGLNITKNLCPDGPPTFEQPYDISHNCDTLLWHSWTCSIGIKANELVSWGLDTAASKFTGVLPETVIKIIGHDSPIAFIGEGALVYGLDGRTSSRAWIDVGVDGRGRIFAVNERAELFDSWEEFIRDNATRTWHLPPSERRSLFVLESRCFVQVDQHLFELGQDLRLVESIEGLNFKIIPGRRNRLGVVTDAGDAYIIGTREKEAEVVEVDGDVRHLGLGSDFDLVVTEAHVLRRGTESRSVLLTAEGDGEWLPVDVAAAKISDIKCGRWTTIFTVNAFG